MRPVRGHMRFLKVEGSGRLFPNINHVIAWYCNIKYGINKNTCVLSICRDWWTYQHTWIWYIVSTKSDLTSSQSCFDILFWVWNQEVTFLSSSGLLCMIYNIFFYYQLSGVWEQLCWGHVNISSLVYVRPGERLVTFMYTSPHPTPVYWIKKLGSRLEKLA